VLLDGSRDVVFNRIRDELGFKYNYNVQRDNYKSTLGVISVPTGVNTKNKPITTQIQIKLTVSSLMVKEQMFNTLLVKLPNFRSIKRTPDSRYEFEILREFNSSVMKYGEGRPVTIKIRNMEFNDVIGMMSGPPGAKADLILINSYGQGVCFISHKHGSSATDFQQYSGISKASGLQDDSEVVQFIRDVVTKKEEAGLYPLYRIIRNGNLKERAVFGNEFIRGPRSSSENNIDFIAQGRIVITYIPNNGDTILKINFTTHLIHKTELYKLPTSYDPTLGTRPAEESRRLELEMDVITGTRGGIFPRQYMTARKNSKEI
jgi:hypothetical protein